MINNFFFFLIFLIKRYLFDNNLSGSIPESIGNLTKLKEL